MASTLPDDVIDEQFLCCSLCLRSYIEPKILPCLHTFCRGCLESHVVKAGSERNFNCPECFADLCIPEKGIKVLKTNYFVASLLEVASSQSAGPRKCSNCESSSGKFWCLDCRQYLCSGCRDAHNWLKLTKHHRVMTLGEIQSGKYQGELKHRQPVLCDTHRRQEIENICLTCDKAVCKDCKESEHRDHRVGTLHEAAQRDISLLQSLCSCVHKQQKIFEASLHSMDAYERQCRAEKDRLLQGLQRQKEHLAALLDTCHADLVKQIEVVYADEQTQQEKRREQMKQTVQTMSHQRDLTDKLLKHGKDADIMTMGKLLKINLNNYSFAMPVELDSKLVVQYTPTSIHKARILPLFGKIVKKRNVTVKPTNHIPVSMDEAMHHGKFAPKLLYSFRAKTNNDAKGCKPTGMTISKDNEIIIVDDINKKIKVFDPKGALKSEICPKGDHALIDPWDITITEQGNYAITDRGARTVKIFTPNGNYVGSFGSHLKCPWGIACNSRGELIVTDPASKGVLIHDKEGHLLFELQSQNQNSLFMCPEYVAVNKNDDIIVSDFDKHCITVFDMQGRFLYRYGNRGKGIHEFHVPCGVCTDSCGNILVVDYNNQRIHLLSEDGQFRCFLATKEDGVMTPQAIAVNSDDHLVLVDGTNVKTFTFPEEPERPQSESLNFFNLMYDGVVFEDENEPNETDI